MLDKKHLSEKDLRNIDLHIHTEHSPKANLSIIDILKIAEKKNIECISFTDHSTTKAYEDLSRIDLSKIYSGKIIKGIEINCCYNDLCIDVLGYGYNLNNIDILNKWLSENANFEKTIEFQQSQLLYLIELLKLYNSTLPKEKVLKFNENNVKIRFENEFAGFAFAEELIKYPENNWLFEGHENIFISPGLFFKVFCCDANSPFYIDVFSYKPKIKDVIDIIHKCGGLAFLAHPVVYFYGDEKVAKDFLNNVVYDTQIDGLECYHIDLSEKEMEYLLDFCNLNDLYISGGSDFHEIGRHIGLLSNGKNITDENMKWINKYC